MRSYRFLSMATLLIVACLVATTTQSDASGYPDGFDRSASMQEKRKSALDMAEKQGVIDRVTPRDDYIVTWTGPRWRQAPYKLKKQIAETVVAYYWAKNPRLDHTLIRDHYDGSTVGNYNAHFGLRLSGS